MGGMVIEGKSSLPALYQFDKVEDRAVKELPVSTDRL